MTAVEQSMGIVGRRYQLVGQLGQGGMGAVYRAVDRLTGQTVALKRVVAPSDTLQFDSQPHTDTINMRLALAQEFRVLASLRHPHIIDVLDYGFDEEGQPYFTMRLLEGSINLLKAGQGKFLPERVELLIQMLQALAYLHRRGIIHRDLKPGNVMVVEDSVKVLDFGLAMARGVKTEENEEVAGTLAYIAPEVLQGLPAEEPADLYAVGVIAYQIFTGRHPFNTSNLGQLINDVLMSSPDLSPLESLTKDMLTAAIPVERDDEPEETTAAAGYDKTLVGDELTEIEHAPDYDPMDMPTTALDSYRTEAIPELPADVMETYAAAGRKEDDDLSLAAIINRLMIKDPLRRYRDAYDVIDDLSAAMGQTAPEESAAIRESFLQAAEFVGREQELAMLESALADAMKGRGSSWLVGGESGMGKSRLLEELRVRALVQGMLVLRGRAVSGGGLSYQLWRDPMRWMVLMTEDMDDLDAGILKDVVTDIDQLLGRSVPDAVEVEATAYQARLLGTIASIFRRQQQPILLMLEDLQWSQESLDVVRLLTGMVGDLPLLIVGSYRVDEKPDMADELPGMRHLKLEPLNRDGIAALSASMLGEAGQQPELVELLVRETEGNIFFLIEVMRALAEEAGRLDNIGRRSLPQYIIAGGIQAVIKRRLERVPEWGREMLQLAAVAGRELDLRVLQHLQEAGFNLDAWLANCANIAVLEVSQGEWRFAHGKLREAMLGGLSEEERPALHRKVAEAIEKAYPDKPEQAQILARHWRIAGDPIKERIYAQAAGDYSLHISAFNDAAAHFYRALELLSHEELPASERSKIEPDLLLKLGETLQYTGDYEAAAVHLKWALDLCRELKNRPGIVRALALLGDVAWRRGDHGDARQFCEESLSVARKLKDDRGVAYAQNRIGFLLFEQGDYPAATPMLEEALSLARATADQQIEAMALNNLGTVAYAQGDYVTASERFEATLEISRAGGERRKMAGALLNLGGLAGAREDFNKAAEYLKQTLEICHEIGERRGVALALHNLGMVSYDQGRYEQARGYFEESLPISQAIGNRHGCALTLYKMGDVTRMQNDVDGARLFYREALQLAYEIEAMPTVTEILTGLAAVEDNPLQAVAWLEMVLAHPATFEGTRRSAQELVDYYRTILPEGLIAEAAEQGRGLDISEVVAVILAGTAGAEE